MDRGRLEKSGPQDKEAGGVIRYLGYPLCCTFQKGATKWVLQVPNDPGLLPYLVVRFFLEIFHDPSQARINIAPETLSA